MMHPKFDQTAYDTGAQTIGHELTLALFGGPVPEGAHAATAPGAEHAADMARGAIAEAIATLSCIIGIEAAIAFVSQVLFEIVRQEIAEAAAFAEKNGARP